MSTALVLMFIQSGCRSLATAALDIHLPDVDLQSFVERPSYQDRRSIVVLMLDDDSGN